MSAQTTVQFQLRLDGETFDASATVPSDPIRMTDLLPILRSFNDAVIAHGVEREQSRGFLVSCRAGCGSCCRQLVPIAEAEAISLGEWVATLPDDERARVRAAFDRALEGLGPALVDRLHRREPDDLRQLGLEPFRAGVPCPFLVNESCGIYSIRPMKCREYLVTSAPSHCAEPSAESISMVPLPTAFSTVLARSEGERSHWLPLVLALEWHDAHASDAPRRLPGPELLHEFVTSLTR